MTEKKTRTRKKTIAKATTTTGGQQTTLLAIFGKQPAATEAIVDISSETDGDAKSEAESIIDVVGSSPPPPPPQRTRGKGKRARQPEPESEPSPSSTALSSPLSTSPRATPPPLHSRPSFTSTDVYSSLRRSRRSQSVALADEDAKKSLKTRTLFATVRKSRSRPALEYTPNGSEERLSGSQGAPIEIVEEEPEPFAPLTKAAMHAFFQPRKESEKEKKVQAKGKGKGKVVDLTLAETFGGQCKVENTRRNKDRLDPPWPNAESTHVTVGENGQLEARECIVPRRTTTSVSTSIPISDERTQAWAKSYKQCTQDDPLELSPNPFDAWRCLRRAESTPDEMIPEEHKTHPAIARLLAPDGAQHAFAPPARACEVLGNDGFAQPLVEWLKQLELRGSKEVEVPIPTKGQPRERRVIVTDLGRRKRRRVENENEYDPDIVVDDDCLDPEDIVLTREVGNTFAITGPQGTGKSAAVHACAQELGWSVFEVYPGIGRRGAGANGLASLVGSVGANHTVGGSGDGEVQQSLIMLDEVDVLFDQDISFWAAVTTLARESRRPVVIVANDLDCIPRDELPVHQYVEFQAADSDLAASYLYAQARATGCARIPSRAQFKALFEGTVPAPRIPDFSVPDAPQHPLPRQLDRSPDLRRVLEDMNFWLAHGQAEKTYAEDVPREVRAAWVACGKDVVEYVGDWSADEVVREGESQSEIEDEADDKVRTELLQLSRLWNFAESLSEVDAKLERRWMRQMHAEEVDRFAPGDDDEYRRDRAVQLCKPSTPYEHPGIAEFCWDAEIALEAICLARRVLERGEAGERARAGLVNRQGWDSRRLEEVRAEHQEKLMTFLDAAHVTGPSTPLLPRPALVLDTIPAVRAMVAADDVMVANASRVVRGRNVRTSARVAAAGTGVMQHERYITLDSEGLVAVQKTEYVM